MTSNWLLVMILVVLATMSVFLPEILADGGEYGIGGDLPESPSIWDILSFNGSFIWDAMTFSIDGMPNAIGTIFWMMSFVTIYCAVRLVRGVT